MKKCLHSGLGGAVSNVFVLSFLFHDTDYLWRPSKFERRSRIFNENWPQKSTLMSIKTNRPTGCGRCIKWVHKVHKGTACALRFSRLSKFEYFLGISNSYVRRQRGAGAGETMVLVHILCASRFDICLTNLMRVLSHDFVTCLWPLRMSLLLNAHWRCSRLIRLLRFLDFILFVARNLEDLFLNLRVRRSPPPINQIYVFFLIKM